MELERVTRELIVLARKDDLSPSDHQKARALMKELRRMGMTNAQISELTRERWAETTVKEYTRGVTVMDSQPWQSTTALFGEMVSKGLTTADVRETIAVRDKLESGGTSLAEITNLLTDLKRTGTDIGSLVALYREWKSSGLTASEAASTLKYKGEIEGMGFGLDSLSDIAQVARALGNPMDVLGAIEKYRDVAELDNGLKAAQGRLADEESRVRDRVEAGEQAIREVEERERSTRDRLSQLDQEVNARVELLSKAEELEEHGLDARKVGELCAAVTGISAKHGLGREEAVSEFFSQLKDYDAILGFEAEAGRWETIAETKRLQGETAKAQLESLEMKYKERKEAVDAMESLIKQGVRPDQIPVWNRILGMFKGPEQFDEELERYKGIEEFLNAKDKEIERRELEVAEFDARAKVLRQELAEIQSSIKALSESGVREITKVGNRAVAKLRTLEEETSKWGELKAEAGKLEKELMFARYFTTADPEVLKVLPRNVVYAFLDRATTWCKLNEVNPMVGVPTEVSQRYKYLLPHTEVSLLDLITWVRVGLAGASQ